MKHLQPTRLLVAIATVVGFAGHWAPVQAEGRPVRGELALVGDVPVLRLWGTPQERGYAHGYLLAGEIVKLVNDWVASEASGGPEGFARAQIVVRERMQIPAQYEAELRGVVSGVIAQLGSEARIAALGRQLAYADLAVVNCLPELGQLGCSSFAAWGELTTDGNMLAGRNLDWHRLPALEGSQVVIAQCADPQRSRMGWVSITWPGFIGCLTGMNADGVTVSMHDVHDAKGGRSSGFTPRGLALRDAIESAHLATAVENIVTVLRAHPSAMGNNVPVTWPYTGEREAAVVLEYDGDTGNDGGVTIRLADSQSSLFCTNHYVKRGAKPGAPEPRCERYDLLNRRLVQRTRNALKLDRHRARDILKAVAFPREPGQPMLTLHSVVFEPNKRVMHVSFARAGKPATAYKATTLDVSALLAGDQAPPAP